MQCKDIDEAPILEWLKANASERKPALGFRYGEDSYIYDAFEPSLPKNLKRAKLDQLIKRDLIDGCTCGCRGDFFLTVKGHQWLNDHAGERI